MIHSPLIALIVATVCATGRRVVRLVRCCGWMGGGAVEIRVVGLSAPCGCYQYYEDSELKALCGSTLTYVKLMGMTSKAVEYQNVVFCSPNFRVLVLAVERPV